MTPIRLTQHATCLALAALVTLGVLGGLNELAAPNGAAAMQMVGAASAPRA